MMLNRWVGNWQTALLGVVAGAFAYLASLGPNLPQTKADWGKALTAAALAGLGLTAKDATTGSAPK